MDESSDQHRVLVLRTKKTGPHLSRGFFDLPHYCRYRIYQQVFSALTLKYGHIRKHPSDDSQHYRPRAIFRKDEGWHKPNILLTCKAIYEDAFPVFAEFLSLDYFGGLSIVDMASRMSQFISTRLQYLGLDHLQINNVHDLSPNRLRAVFPSIKVLDFEEKRGDPWFLEEMNQCTTLRDAQLWIWVLLTAFGCDGFDLFNEAYTEVVSIKAFFTVMRPVKGRPGYCKNCHQGLSEVTTISINKRKVLHYMSCDFDKDIAHRVLLGINDKPRTTEQTWNTCVCGGKGKDVAMITETIHEVTSLA